MYTWQFHPPDLLAVVNAHTPADEAKPSENRCTVIDQGEASKVSQGKDIQHNRSECERECLLERIPFERRHKKKNKSQNAQASLTESGRGLNMSCIVLDSDLQYNPILFGRIC